LIGPFSDAGSEPPFCTLVHIFAQRFLRNLIDARKHNHYLARQIEPGKLETLRISLEAQQPHGGCAARLNQEAENFTAQFKRAQQLNGRCALNFLPEPVLPSVSTALT
jgi:hypothetical protein